MTYALVNMREPAETSGGVLTKITLTTSLAVETQYAQITISLYLSF